MRLSQLTRRLMPSAGLALALALSMAAPVEARIYKWTDEEGNVVYSHSPPPPGVKAEQVREARPPADDPEGLNNSLRERAEAFEERRDERQKSDQDRQAERERAQRQKEVCDQLRENLQVLQTSNQVREETDDGGYTMLTEEQRQAQIASTQERIEKECNN